MAETPREPDRFEEKGDELAAAFQTVRCPDRRTLACRIAAALRAEHKDGARDAQERAAEWIRDNAHKLLSGDELAEAILKLKSPAAEVRICPKDLQEDCSAPDGEIVRCTDRACPMKAPAAAPAADLRAWRLVGPFRISAPAQGAEAPDLRRVVERAQVELDRRDARIAELEAALRELTRAATEHANAHGCSGDLGARLSDAKALLAARTSQGGTGEGT